MSEAITAPTQPAYIAPFLASTQPKLGPKVKLSMEEGLTIAKDASDDEIKSVVRKVYAYKAQFDQCRVILDRFLGQLICEYAARHEKTWAEAISDLNLAGEGSLTGLGWRVVEKLPRMVQRNLPESFALPGLRTGHFDQVSSFSGPEDPEKEAEWRDRCHQILLKAAENPAERGPTWVAQNMRELQKEFGILPKRKEAVARLMPKVLETARNLMDWSEDDFARAEAKTGTTRAKLRDYFDSCCNDLMERHVIPAPDPEEFIPPWMPPTPAADGPVTEAEVVTEEPEPGNE